MINRRQLRKRCCLANIGSEDNLFLAAMLARKRKTRRPDVEGWMLRRESLVIELSRAILSEEWEPSPYRFFEIHEPKRRLIAAAPFSDRVVHHALCQYLQPLLERRFIDRSFSCQIGKGTTAARQVCRKLTNRHRYVLKCDVHKFFHQIDHAILKEKLAVEVKCAGTRRLIAKIIDSFATGQEVSPVLFPGDDLFTGVERKRGLPIGNLTSQLWGNFYLDALDHHLTEKLGHGAYLRYTDDFLLFGDSRAELWELNCEIERELAKLRLILARPKSRLMQTSEGVPFCGFRFLPGRAPRILGATKRRFEKRRHRLHRTGMPRVERREREFAWHQFSIEGNVTGLWQAYADWPEDGSLRERRRRCNGTSN